MLSKYPERRPFKQPPPRLSAQEPQRVRIEDEFLPPQEWDEDELPGDSQAAAPTEAQEQAESEAEVEIEAEEEADLPVQTAVQLPPQRPPALAQARPQPAVPPPPPPRWGSNVHRPQPAPPPPEPIFPIEEISPEEWAALKISPAPAPAVPQPAPMLEPPVEAAAALETPAEESHAEETLAEEVPVPEQPKPQPAAEPAQKPAAETSLRDLIRACSSLPAHTAVLGMCADGLPVLFDLLDARPGPFLVTGDPGCGKTALLHTLLHTAASLTNPAELRFVVLAAKPQEYAALASGADTAAHCNGIFDSRQPAAWEQILRAAEVAEQRYAEGRAGTPLLLVLDDLRFIGEVDSTVRLNLEWLFQNGPAAHVWPLAALPTQAALQMGRWTRLFGTRLIGHMPAESARRLALFADLPAQDLRAGREFALHLEDGWLRFFLPLLPEPHRRSG